MATAAPAADLESGLLRRISHFDAHLRFLISIGLAALALLIAPWNWHWTTRFLVTWNTFSGSALALAWLTILSAKPAEVARSARLQDSSRTTIFIFVIVAACTSVFAVAAELGTAKGLDGTHLGGHVLFSVLTVLTSWFLVHTICALRYAHIFYDLKENGDHAGGLNFPDEEAPDYLDFAYFSFVIGMTSQVSDVTISSKRLRRLALLQGLLAFGFNLSILGLTINMISGLF